MHVFYTHHDDKSICSTSDGLAKLVIHAHVPYLLTVYTINLFSNLAGIVKLKSRLFSTTALSL